MKMVSAIAIILFLSSLSVKAESNYSELLTKADIVRAFWAPCELTRLNQKIEIAEIDLYVNQGFVLLAKIKLPPTDQDGNRIPECQYTFVRKTHLR